MIDTTTTYKPPNGSAAAPTTKFRTQTQAHTHWVNDICLAQSNSALVSGSSDLTVKLWRPTSAGADGEVQEPVTLGEHADYVRCVASPSPSASWVVSGGLDRKVCLWDLSGAGKTLEIDVHGEEHSEKGSVYALAAHHSIIANGGAEASVRLWDPRTGGRITKFLGHTDLIRAILISESGDTLLTASSDQTVKVWSLAAGRCMYTMTMHDTSVWDLFSERPDLSVFYSADRAGMVAKTDVRGSASLSEMDDGISLAVAREHQGVNKVVACGGHIWTATSSSSINRWADIDTADVAAELFPDSAPAGLAISGAGLHHHQRVPSAASTVRPRSSTVQSSATGGSQNSTATKAASVLRRSVLRISNTATYSSQTVVPPVDAAGSTTTLSASAGGDAVSARKGSVVSAAVPVSAGNGENEKKEDEEEGAGSVVPVHQLPEETIEGQFGLVKHRLLNDRRRVLTLDTAGNVLLWDLIKVGFESLRLTLSEARQPSKSGQGERATLGKCYFSDMPGMFRG